jgi:hypothetical protein
MKVAFRRVYSSEWALAYLSRERRALSGVSYFHRSLFARYIPRQSPPASSARLHWAATPQRRNYSLVIPQGQRLDFNRITQAQSQLRRSLRRHLVKSC